MMRYAVITFATLGTAAVASAQYQPYGPNGGAGPYQQQTYYPPGTVMPNVYNPTNQPLSPYLNLFRNNPAVNYYYGVRPGTAGGSGFGVGAPFTAPGGYRAPFFPQLAMAPDPAQPREVGVGDVLAPAGHPVVYNNTMGFFPSPYGNRGSAARPGLAGVGTTRPR